jgi:hypothetical protein
MFFAIAAFIAGNAEFQKVISLAKCTSALIVMPNTRLPIVLLVVYDEWISKRHIGRSIDISVGYKLLWRR